MTVATPTKPPMPHWVMMSISCRRCLCRLGYLFVPREGLGEEGPRSLQETPIHTSGCSRVNLVCPRPSSPVTQLSDTRRMIPIDSRSKVQSSLDFPPGMLRHNIPARCPSLSCLVFSLLLFSGAKFLAVTSKPRCCRHLFSCFSRNVVTFMYPPINICKEGGCSCGVRCFVVWFGIVKVLLPLARQSTAAAV